MTFLVIDQSWYCLCAQVEILEVAPPSSDEKPKKEVQIENGGGNMKAVGKVVLWGS